MRRSYTNAKTRSGRITRRVNHTKKAEDYQMACAFSDDLRLRALSAACDGMAARSAAARVGSGASTAIGWIANGRQAQMTWPTRAVPAASGWRHRRIVSVRCLLGRRTSRAMRCSDGLATRRRSRWVAVLLLFGDAHRAGRLKRPHTHWSESEWIGESSGETGAIVAAIVPPTAVCCAMSWAEGHHKKPTHFVIRLF